MDAWRSDYGTMLPLAASRLGTTPIHFSVALGELAPGEYDCQVTVLDPAGGKVTFWQVPIEVVP